MDNNLLIARLKKLKSTSNIQKCINTCYDLLLIYSVAVFYLIKHEYFSSHKLEMIVLYLNSILHLRDRSSNLPSIHPTLIL